MGHLGGSTVGWAGCQQERPRQPQRRRQWPLGARTAVVSRTTVVTNRAPLGSADPIPTQGRIRVSMGLDHGFPCDSVVKNPQTQETLIPSLGGEDSLEEEMETHSSILAWRIPWTEEPGRMQSLGSQRI